MIGTKTTIVDDTGVTIVPDAVYEDLRSYDLLVVPGGSGTRAMMSDAQLIDYLQELEGRPAASPASAPAPCCSGPRDTSRASGPPRITSPSTRCAPLPRGRRDRRIVEDGLVTTAGGVTSSLDLGLYLVERWWGAEARERVADVMAYRGYDPA